MTKLTLVSNSKNNIDLVLESKKTGDPVTEITIQKFIDASKYTSLLINEENIKNAVAELNDVLKPLQADQTGREIRYEILERLDATITITIDSDEMAATAEITTTFGGKHLSAKAILNSAQDSGVKKGFSKEELLKLAQLASKEPPGKTVSLQIATGRLAVDGKDAKIKHLVQSVQERILRPRERDDGTVDMHDLGDIICVSVGDPLAQKIPLTQGKQGHTVTGIPLIPEPGEDITFNAGEGTSFSPKDDNLLISQLVGVPRFIDNGMEVDEVYQIKNVDVGTGNIDFNGSVIIDGDVCEGMTVVATGDITVSGFVESAILKAGGDIIINGGIIGRKQDVEKSNVTDMHMSVNISAKGTIYARYCQYANIFCGSDIRIENQLMHSILNVGGRLWLGTAEQANGKLIGGFIKVVTSVHAGIVGATAGSNTIINFESKMLGFKQSQLSIDSRLKTESDIITELKAAISKLKKLPKESANPKMLKKVVATYSFHANNMGELLQEKETVEEETQTYMSSVYIEATEKLYHGVVFIVGDFNDRSRREYGPSRMNYKERKVHINPIVHT
jgi:uncharacterized protein (DUF342 family)